MLYNAEYVYTGRLIVAANVYSSAEKRHIVTIDNKGADNKRLSNDYFKVVVTNLMAKK
jgi:hypothetical protein